MNSSDLPEPDVGRLIDAVAAELDAAALYYGHGTDNPRDEAAALVFHVAGLEHGDAAAYGFVPDAQQRAHIAELTAERIRTRQPLPYLLHEAWFAGRPYYVDERVLVPRSPIAELIQDEFAPWLDADRIRTVLDIGTGSGCIAIATALALPAAQVTATDISAAALAVAEQNIARHDVAERVRLVRTDLADGLEGPFDLIVSNPPYVPDAEGAGLPVEYAHEPALGLFSGADGLDSARRILQDAPGLLSRDGALILEVGAQWEALEQAFPHLPFTWLEFAAGGEGVALIWRADLAREAS